MDLPVGALPLLLEQVDVDLDLVERLLQRLDEHPEPSHRLLGEGVCVLAERLGRERLDRVLDANVEGTAFGRERTLGLGEQTLRLPCLQIRPIAIGKRPPQPDGVDAGGACDESDQEGDDDHEGNTR